MVVPVAYPIEAVGGAAFQGALFGSAGASNYNGHQNDVPALTIRKDFPESWIWEDLGLMEG